MIMIQEPFCNFHGTFNKFLNLCTVYCVQTVHDVLTNHFKLRQVDFRSQDNLSGAIEIDTASCMGRQIVQRGRPMLVRFTTHKDKDVVMKKIRSERTGGLIKISDQYPATMKEKRMAQIDELKHTRDMYKDSGKKVALVKDKLMVGSQVILDAFEKNKLPITPTSNPPSLKSINKTQIEDINGSRFMGFSSKVTSVRHAAEVREALYQSPHVAQADHTIYAYVVTDESGMKITGHSDDGEWSASKILMNQVLEKQITNAFIAVSRIHEGPNLGKMRFNIISRVATEAIEMLL